MSSSDSRRTRRLRSAPAERCAVDAALAARMLADLLSPSPMRPTYSVADVRAALGPPIELQRYFNEDMAPLSAGDVCHLLAPLARHAPHRLQALWPAIEGCASPPVRAGAAAALAHANRGVAVPALRGLCCDDSELVRAEAVRSLSRWASEATVNWVVTLARDSSSCVRRAALFVLARLDDRRALSELVAARHDEDDQVRTLALEILSGKHGCVPALRHFPRRPGDRPIWDVWQSDIDAVKRWASERAHELLGRPCVVRQYREGLGRTWAGGRRDAVLIELSAAPVTTGHPQGVEIMRALALHELGHHLYDLHVRGSCTVRGLARARGVRHIYEILLDERLERGLRARRPEWGIHFDRLASYAFAQTEDRVSLAEYARLLRRTVPATRQAIRRGHVPGRLVSQRDFDDQWIVILRPGDALRIPGLLPPLVAFLMCLRCGFDPRQHPNPAVAAAIAEVPGNLKDLSHAEVLRVAERIAARIGHDAESRNGIRRLRRSLHRHAGVLDTLRRALDRLAGCAPLRAWLPRDARGIRRDPPTVDSVTLTLPNATVGGVALNLGSELGFRPLSDGPAFPPDPAAQALLEAAVQGPARRLRRYFERLGEAHTDEYGVRRGHRVDLGRLRQALYRHSPHVLVHAEQRRRTDAYVGILIDRSGSMCDEIMERAKRFAALLCRSLAGLPGIEGQVSAFDDRHFYRLGDFRRNTAAALQAGAGNNDAGALARAAELALASRRRHKLLIMISDGLPTECTLASLQNLVRHLVERYAIACVQIAVEPLEHIAFPIYADLSGYPLTEAADRFGALLMNLGALWHRDAAAVRGAAGRPGAHRWVPVTRLSDGPGGTAGFG